MDVVFVKDLKIEAIIGVHPWERQLAQNLLIDLELGTDTARAAVSDSVADALDYEAVSRRVSEFVQAGQFQLIETLAERTTAMLLSEFPTTWVRFTVHKPGALRDAKSVGVRIERTRD